MITNILTIAGTDCTGGAGIQADIKSISANGSYAMSVITAVVAQNTQGVQRVEIMPISLVNAQLDAVFSDVRVDAVKIGMLGTSEIIHCVAKALDKYQPEKVILDPVMVAKSGDRLLSTDAVDTLRKLLVPMVDLLTPNLPEAADLLGITEASNKHEMLEQAKALQVPILLKGGHLIDSESSRNESPDLLYLNDLPYWLAAKRVTTNNSHGTGCTLSAAIATNWANGMTLVNACYQAKDYLTQTLKAAERLTVGQGQGPVHHFYDYY